MIGKILACVAFVGLFLVGLYYGMGREIERQEQETAHHVQQCESNPNYYPELCKQLMGE